MRVAPRDFDRTDLEASARVRGAYPRRWKRILDIAIALALAPFCLLVVGLLWALVRLDGGPGFYGHVRMGQGGETFRCWKIRTMVPDAESRLQDHLRACPEAAAEWEAGQKLDADPRVTPVGNLLRRISFDELPQLWNVLRGDMSLVGPRPVTEDEVARYGSLRWAYLAQKPGVTGIWQVSGRNSVSYEERVKMDVEYLGKVSLRTDIAILLRTFLAVLRRSGR